MRTPVPEPEARERIARETLEIYAPIAQRLGMNLIKAELQDLGFRALHPWRHAVIAKRIRTQPVVRRESLVQIEGHLAQRLAKEKLVHRLISRVKSPWSIYTKMRGEHKNFAQVMDVFGFRVVLRSVPDCYHALGVVHAAYKPLDAASATSSPSPRQRLQSLHTVLFVRTAPLWKSAAHRGDGPDRRTRHRRAWSYKHGAKAKQRAEPRAQLDRQSRRIAAGHRLVAGVPGERQGRPFPDEVYLSRPRATSCRCRAMPPPGLCLRGAHRRGNRAVAARVDASWCRCAAPGHGQRAEIVTAKSSTPKPQWLEFVVSGKARTSIRQQLKSWATRTPCTRPPHAGPRAEALETSLERVPAPRLEAFLTEHRYQRLAALLLTSRLATGCRSSGRGAVREAPASRSASPRHRPSTTDRS